MTLPVALSFRYLLAGILSLIGCGCGKVGNSDAAGSQERSVEAPAGVATPMEGVEVRLVVPRAVAAGDRVPISIRISNTAVAPVDLYLRGREITVDIVVSDSTGDEVWRRLEGEIIPAILQLKTLASGEVLELTYEWDQTSRRGERAPAGVYGIRAFVLTDGSSSLVSNEASFLIRR
jgi:hypothetical protein